MRSAGIMFPVNDVRLVPSIFPVNGSKIVAPVLEKLPERMSGVGTLKRPSLITRSNIPSQLPKKKSLSLMIGPPSVAPGIVRRFFGLLSLGKVLPPILIDVGWNEFFARKKWLS